MRQLQEVFQKTEVVHRFEGRGVDRIAAKIAQKICMFFENDRIHPGSGKEKPEHHPGWATADDAAAAGDCLAGLVHLPLKPSEAECAVSLPQLLAGVVNSASGNLSTALTRIATEMFPPAQRAGIKHDASAAEIERVQRLEIV
jgi:hypothetical protein